MSKPGETPDVGPTTHVVRPGDHLARVAAFHQRRTFAPLWNAPENAALRRARPNPNILAEGDPVHVPARIQREVDRGTEHRHRFVAELRPLTVTLVRQRLDGTPPPDAPKEVLVEGKPVKFSSPTAGSTEFPVGPLDDRCTVRAGSDDIILRVGFLQPVATVAGQRERLNNLGYDAGEKDDPQGLQFRSAVEEFQCDHGMKVDGKCGTQSQAKLASIHGC